ncbi:MAG: heavy metal translocating P-type ATPase [Burkholderiales bacterium]|nr:heavy metal translocating P-type ATPase [Burkholderiales bacterium]
MPSLLSFKTLLAVTLAALAGGGVLWLGGDAAAAHLMWSAGTAFVLAVLLVIIARSLARGEFGLDIVAALSMSGSLLIGESLAGNVIALMFAGGQVLEDHAQQRAKRDMTALLARVPRTASRYDDGHLAQVPLEDLKPGDRILVRPGEVVPVDGAVSNHPALLDESAMTGEPLPVRRAVGQPAMSGSTNAGAAFDLVAERSAEQSTYAGIVRLVREAQESKAPMARLADRWGLGFLGLTILIAGTTWLLTGDARRTLAVLVVATPCPLILAVPVAIVAGLSRAAKHGVLVKSAGALEAMARARTLLFDKTGTLTGGAPRVVSIEPAAGYSEEEILLLAGSLAQGSQHVVSAALVAEARERGLSLPPPAAVREEHGAGLAGVVDARPVVLGSLAHVAAHLPQDSRRAVPSAEESAERMVTAVGADGRFAGLIVLADEVREEAREALIDLKDGGFNRIVLVTGDRADVAAAVAARLPIDEVVADATPTQKVEVVRREALLATTVMVGDGVNDAPALAAADIGVAMGARGAAASSEAADAVILVDSLDRLPRAFAAARRARSIALQSVAAGMALSTAGMVAAGFGYLTPLQGALIQEAIDVAVVLNALRVLAPGATERRLSDRGARRVVPGEPLPA